MRNAAKSILRGAFVSLAWATPLLAATPDRAPLVKSLSACREVSDNAARLACYDRAAAGLDDAERRGEVVVIDRARAAAAHHEAFGLPVPSLDFITRALAPGEVDTVSGVLRDAHPDSYGRWTFVLQDGAVWRMIDGELMRPPEVGSKVVIRRASLGSYVMNVGGQHAGKVHRDQ